jgi:hypothetical protein
MFTESSEDATRRWRYKRPLRRCIHRRFEFRFLRRRARAAIRLRARAEANEGALRRSDGSCRRRWWRLNLYVSPDDLRPSEECVFQREHARARRRDVNRTMERDLLGEVDLVERKRSLRF